MCHFNIEEEETKDNFRNLDKKSHSASKRNRVFTGLASSHAIKQYYSK